MSFIRTTPEATEVLETLHEPRLVAHEPERVVVLVGHHPATICFPVLCRAIAFAPACRTTRYGHEAYGAS